MTANDFCLWFAGFCAAIEGVPTPEQWDVILEKAVTVTPGTWIAPIYPAQPFVPQGPSWKYVDGTAVPQ